MSGHAPFGAQVILNRDEYGQLPQAAGSVLQGGNWFTGVTDPRGLAQITDALSQPAAIGRLARSYDRVDPTAWLCPGLGLAGQQVSGFHYAYQV